MNGRCCEEMSDHSSLQNCLVKMFDTQDHVDVKLHVKSQDTSKTFQAHALILAIRSPVLADTLYNTEGKVSTVVINSSSQVFEILLRYLYTDSISTSCPDELREVSKTARLLKISGVTRNCKYELEKIPVTIKNICSMLKASQYFKMEDLSSKCSRFIQETPEEVLFESSEFKNASKEIASTILSLKKLPKLSSAAVAIQWLKQRKIRDRSVLSGLGISSFSSGEFVDLVEKFPSFFTFKEVACILGNAIRPGVFELPPWCDATNNEESNKVNEESPGSIQVRTDCNKFFPKFQLCGENEFEASSIFEVKVTRHFQEQTHLSMLELAFGANFVPAKNLEVELFRFEPNSGAKTGVPFVLKSTRDNYYVCFRHKIPVQANLPFVFCLRLRAFGLKKWGEDAPVSDCMYRVAQISGDIFYNMRLRAFGHESVCITFLSDWLVFINPIRQKKKPFLTSLFYS